MLVSAITPRQLWDTTTTKLFGNTAREPLILWLTSQGSNVVANSLKFIVLFAVMAFMWKINWVDAALLKPFSPSVPDGLQSSFGRKIISGRTRMHWRLHPLWVPAIWHVIHDVMVNARSGDL